MFHINFSLVLFINLIKLKTYLNLKFLIFKFHLYFDNHLLIILILNFIIIIYLILLLNLLLISINYQHFFHY